MCIKFIETILSGYVHEDGGAKIAHTLRGHASKSSQPLSNEVLRFNPRLDDFLRQMDLETGTSRTIGWVMVLFGSTGGKKVILE